MHSNSQLMFKKYAMEYFTAGSKILEIGPDKIPSTYQTIVGGQELQWDTLDIRDISGLTFPRSSPDSFPVPDCSYDVVFSGQVIEHVVRIWDWMKELARVAKSGGRVITIGPVSWPYHEAPVDCWRLYPEAMRALSEFAGLRLEKSHFESLELPTFRNSLPGRSPEHQPRALRYSYRILGRLGFPVEKSFDCITVAIKS
jgi:SAM-dependent methyltransferase